MSHCCSPTRRWPGSKPVTPSPTRRWRRISDADTITAVYAKRSGRDLSDLGFHLGLGYFKIAVICEGIYYRYTHGQTLGEGFGEIGAAPEPLIQAGLAIMKENS